MNEKSKYLFQWLRISILHWADIIYIMKSIMCHKVLSVRSFFLKQADLWCGSVIFWEFTSFWNQRATTINVCIHTFWILEFKTCINILSAHPAITINWDFSPYTETLTVLVSYFSIINHTAIQLYSTFNSNTNLRNYGQRT